MLALALAGRPQMLIADEPTSALDVVTQAQVVELLERLTREQGLALLLISHDLRVVESVGRTSHRDVRRAGDRGGADRRGFFRNPLHPYTKMLLASAPGRRGRLDDSVFKILQRRLPGRWSAAADSAIGVRSRSPPATEEEPELLSAGIRPPSPLSSSGPHQDYPVEKCRG